jgi:D-alanyl-D-alanine carboxypeptidase
MRIKLPRIFSPFKEFPELIGHSGLSGAFAFYCPSRDVFLAGTVNQLSAESTSFKLMLKFLR